MEAIIFVLVLALFISGVLAFLQVIHEFNEVTK